MTNKQYAGYDIRSGFLGGDILADDLGHERPVDLSASCARYAKLCAEAIEAEYPGADVTVDYEVNASGGTPCTLETSVLTADGYGNIGAYGNEACRIADDVDHIMGHIWEAYEWIVYEETEGEAAPPYTVVFDNGGGVTLWLPDYAHHYDGYVGYIEQAAHDLAVYLHNPDTSDWDGNDPDARFEDTDGYLVYDSVADIMAAANEPIGWLNVIDFAAALRKELDDYCDDED